ncbi:hypothetical protein GCM10008090_33560 [Arenicella chitinivorans]|uniref:CBS domain-containing protein n=1 Tax=Arenicella chitinivorans TaxID=1329800 RepID=A0A918S526_9GAMM|nr:CBS domain-containing protein [Arenicella chitinivorans]GHA20917.1 hypothetical protein GCM10008090_33560 [Arenicella chitinivorans]
MNTLKLTPTIDIDELAWPNEELDLTTSSPAVHFLVDFKKTRPQTLKANLSAVEARRLMQAADVSTEVILDDAGRFLGIISADDIIERKITKKVSEGHRRSEILATDFMIPKRALRTIGYDEICKATIAEVIETLKQSGKPHCLVIDREDHLIRGIFSAVDISAKLQMPIHIQEKSDFYRIHTAAH